MPTFTVKLSKDESEERQSYFLQPEEKTRVARREGIYEGTIGKIIPKKEERPKRPVLKKKGAGGFVAGVAGKLVSSRPEAGLMRSYYFSKAKAPIKEKLIPMSLALLATIVALTLNWVPYLWIAFLMLFIYFMLPEKHQIYRDARKQAEGNFEIDIPNEVYEKAMATGLKLSDITDEINDLVKQGKSETDIIEILSAGIRTGARVRERALGEESLPELEEFEEPRTRRKKKVRRTQR